MNDILNRLHVQCGSDLHDDFVRSLFSEAAVEIERLRKDAERYRWLRAIDDNAPLDASGYPSLTQWKLVVSDRAGRLLFGKELDAAIDAAMREQGANV